MTIRDDVTRVDGPNPGECVLLGGSPMRAVRLAAAATGLLDADGRTLTVRDPRSAVLARRLLDGNIADPRPGSPPVVGELTVIVPVKDRPEQLDRCLTALTGARVVVVDDGSENPQAVRRVTRAHGARLLALPVNRGPAVARNAGLALARTRYVAFVDSDVTVPPPVLQQLAAHFADPAVALVGPLVQGVTRSARPRWFERYDAAASSLSLGRRACCVSVGAAVGWLPSACLVARTSALTGPGGVGGFAEDLRVGEDVDLVWRLLEHGWRVRYDPACQARHDTRATLTGWLGRKMLYGSGGAPLAARHPGATAVARLSPTMAAAGAIILSQPSWAAPVAAVAVRAGSRALRLSLPPCVGTTTITTIAIRGLGWTLKQESALLLRHWWPVTALAATASARAGVPLSWVAYRAIASALIIDTVAAYTIEHPADTEQTQRRIGPLAVLASRRLDDLAYGAGLWVGAIKGGSLRSLAVGLSSPCGSVRRSASLARASGPSMNWCGR